MTSIGSLFSGIGGLDLGLEHAAGGKTVWVCEWDKDASVVLTERFPDAPNLGDITTVRWEDVEPVDILCGGFPCQPFSTAGRRKGTADDRWMWPEFLRAVRSLRPRVAFVENVSALLADTGAFGAVLGDLSEVGYDARWSCLRASDVGAPHRRERVFLFATDTDSGLYGDGCRLLSRPEEPRRIGAHRGNRSRPSCTATPDADQARREGPGSAGRRLLPAGSGATAADAEGNQGWQFDGGGLSDWGAYEPAIRRWEATHGPAPSPVDGRGRLNPPFVEWMMGLPPGWVTDCPISRSAQLRCLGNAVVPQCAEAAWHLLAPVAEGAA